MFNVHYRYLRRLFNGFNVILRGYIAIWEGRVTAVKKERDVVEVGFHRSHTRVCVG